MRFIIGLFLFGVLFSCGQDNHEDYGYAEARNDDEYGDVDGRPVGTDVEHPLCTEKQRAKCQLLITVSIESVSQIGVAKR